MFSRTACRRSPHISSVFNVQNYHSTSHPASNDIIDPKSPEAILFSKAAEHVPNCGFTKEAVNRAVAELQYLDSVQSAVSVCSPHTTEFGLVRFWLKMQREKLKKIAMDPQLELHGLGNEYDRAALLMKKRLLMNSPVIGQLSSALAQLVVPYNMGLSLEELHNLSDDIAFYAGDTSNDSAWYAKRFMLSTIYVKSELYMLQDTSRGFQKTQEFVDSNVAGMKNLGYSYNSFEQWAFFNAISLVNLIKSQLARG